MNFNMSHTRRLRFSSDADIVCLTNARIIIIIIIIMKHSPTKLMFTETDELIMKMKNTQNA